jgi:predicted HicB family RNase H-like nuclease
MKTPTDTLADARRDRKRFLGLHVEPELVERVQAAAKAEDRSVAWWIKQAIVAKLDAQPGGKE